MLLNVGSKVHLEERPPMVLSLDLDVGFNMKDGCGVVASVLTKPVYRTALTVTRYKQYPVN